MSQLIAAVLVLMLGGGLCLLPTSNKIRVSLGLASQVIATGLVWWAVLPVLATQVEVFLNSAPLMLGNAGQPLGAGHRIGGYKHLMQRVDIKQLEEFF